jgi:Domain of unknown function (DUF4124)/Uncharacterized protein conserved in bacteria (DUF2059)
MDRRQYLAVVSLAVMAVAVAVPAVFGDTFQWVDRDGTVRYTDRPPQPGDIAAPPGAKAPTAAPPAVQELMELSGLRQQLEWVTITTRSQIQARLGSIAAEDRAAVDRAAAEAFRAERLQALAQESLGGNLDDANLAQALAWYRTPLGRKITVAELVAAMPQRQQDIADYARTRAMQPVEPGRLERLRRLEELAGASEFAFDLILAVADGLRRGVEPFVSLERRRAMAGAEGEANAGRAQAVEQLRAGILISAEFTYRNLSDAELDAYVTFLASPSGRWLTAEIHRALLHAMRTTTEEAIAGIAAVVHPQQWGRPGWRPTPEVKPGRL